MGFSNSPLSRPWQTIQVHWIMILKDMDLVHSIIYTLTNNKSSLDNDTKGHGLSSLFCPRDSLELLDFHYGNPLYNTIALAWGNLITRLDNSINYLYWGLLGEPQLFLGVIPLEDQLHWLGHLLKSLDCISWGPA